MNKEKLKKIKVIYYPYRAMKKIKDGVSHYCKYMRSLYYISKNKKRVRKKIDNKEVLNVIFVVQYIPGWNKLEPIYSKMKKNEQFNPVIVCVPLNIQNHKLMDSNGNDTYEYFIEHGYEAINALNDDRSWYDLKQLEPDYLFHSRPYNHFMPKCYTSGKIVKYALICNVLYGLSLTKNGQDVTLNKDYFRDVYVYFAFDKYEQEFYKKRFNLGFKMNIQKCYSYGSIGLEQMLTMQENREFTNFDKVVLWTPRWSTDVYIGGSNFFVYKDMIIQLAKKHPNILFVFRPHPLMFNNFIKTGEMSEGETKEFKKYCRNENNIVLDESKEYAEQFWNSDFLITDASGIVPEYFITEKPILYCHTNAHFDYAEYATEMIKSCYEVKKQDDIIKYFNELVNDNDYKIMERKKCVKKYFEDVENSSDNILCVLKGE